MKKQKKKPLTLKQLAHNLIASLNNRGIKCYLWSGGTANQSHYIRFENRLVGSVRVANHPSNPQYNYRFNLRTDISMHKVMTGNFHQYYAPPHDVGWLIKQIVARYNEVKDRQSKYQYNIPLHKRVNLNGISDREQATLNYPDDIDSIINATLY